MSDNNTFETDDLTLAAWLDLHVAPIGTEWVGNRHFWSFEQSDEVVALVTEYIMDTAQVSPREFALVRDELGARMREERRARQNNSVSR